MPLPAIGIDLGTTFSSLAVVNEAGRPEIVPNASGERATASAIWFNEDDDVVMIGKEAVEAAGGYPDRVVRWIKRHMGDPEWRFEVDGKSYTAVDLSALILKKVVQDAERTLGPIKKVVVTVPAYFDEVRRRATKDAAAAAGLEVLRIINEPTAAALAFAATGNVKGRCLVFDFGGGTFDVSIVDIDSADHITVIASDGDHQLGGEDIDKALAAHVNELFEKEHGVPLFVEGEVSSEYTIETEAEKIKIALSKISKKPGLFQRDGKILSNSTIERSTFEDSILSQFMSRIEMLVDGCLNAASLATGDIEHVLLVGGSTRIPAITAMLKDMFSMDPIVNVHPDEAVALGAALQAGMLLTTSGESDLPAEVQEEFSNKTLRDVTSHSYGTIVLHSSKNKLMNEILIKKNTPIPVEKSDQFYTTHAGQTVIECTITQGEDKDPTFVTTIDKGNMDLPPNREAQQEITVTYRYDADGIMSCEFLDVESNVSKKFQLNFENTGSPGAAKRVDFDEDVMDELVIE